MRDLLGDDVLVGKSTLYNALDGLCEHSDKLFAFLRNRWCDMFGSRCDVVLYDLTSTYFECDGTKVERSALQRHGYSRDKRGDCLQVVIALVLTPDGLPVAYEVLRGNTSDKETQMQFLDRVEARHGKPGSIWLMDRGVPTEETLLQMRERGAKYLVGTPRGRLSSLARELSGKPWEEVQHGIQVKCAERDGDTYVLTRSRDRCDKERAMRLRKMRRTIAGFRSVFDRKSPIDRDGLMMKLGALKSECGLAWRFFNVRCPKAGEAVTRETFSWGINWDRVRQARNNEGTYLLRTNLSEENPRMLWRKYMLQGEVEQAFNEIKNDLGLRPVYHSNDERIKAHIFVSFLSFCLQSTLKNIAHAHASGLTPRSIIGKFKSIGMIDVHIPTSDGRELVLTRHVEPDRDVSLLLEQLDLKLPEQPPPRISAM